MQKCYLSGHSACKGGLSREHYISRSVLELIFEGNQGVIRGTPWAHSEEKQVSKESLTARILCQGHNSALSHLDAVAMNVFSSVQTAQTNLQARHTMGSSVVVSGYDFERWLLKVAAGMLASGNFGKGGVALSRTVPEQWCKLLMGEPFPPPWGLYLQPPTSEFATAHREFWYESLSGADNLVRAVHFGLARIPFTLILGRPDQPEKWGAYRPSELEFTDGNAKHSVVFDWLPGPSSGPIEFYRLREE